MKTNGNIKYESFIREALIAYDSGIKIPDWSEVEVLLTHEQKTIKLPEKKYLLGIGGATIAIAGIILAVKLLKVPQNSAEENLPSENSQLTPTPIPDTTSPAITQLNTALKPETKNDTTITSLPAPAKDTLLIKKDTSALTAKTKKENKEEEKNFKKDSSVKAETPKKEKKNKLAKFAPVISDTVTAPESIIITPDTSSPKIKTNPEINNSSTTENDSTKTNPSKKKKKNR
jgi:hypothetical protein